MKSATRKIVENLFLKINTIEMRDDLLGFELEELKDARECLGNALNMHGDEKNKFLLMKLNRSEGE